MIKWTLLAIVLVLYGVSAIIGVSWLARGFGILLLAARADVSVVLIRYFYLRFS
jgi:hypothetical protein